MESPQPEDRAPATIPAFLRYAVLGLGVLYFLLYLYVALGRMSYPHELEWMEGEAVNLVQRVLDGKDLYVEPSIEFVPAIYPPLYFYVSAAVSKVVGAGFLPLRLVSFVSSIGCLALIFCFVRRETGHPLHGFLSAALFAAAYHPSGAWFDIGRVDSFFLVLLLGGVYLARSGSSAPSLCAAAVLVALSFLTKQTALFVAAALGVYCILAKSGYRKAIFLCVFVLVAGGATLLLNRLSDGWYWFYVYELPRQHTIDYEAMVRFWSKDICRCMAIAFGVAMLYPVLRLLQARRDDVIFFGLFLCSMLAVSWATRFHARGYANVLMPAYAAIAVYFGLGVHLILSHAAGPRGAPATPSEGGEPGRANVLGIFVYVLAAIQFASCYYSPTPEIPTASDVQAGRDVVKLVKGIEGEVFVPTYSVLPALAGRNTYAHAMSIYDVLRSKPSEKRRKLALDLNRALIAEPIFAAVILDHRGWRLIVGDDLPVLKRALNARYEFKGSVVEDEKAFWPRVGVKRRPSFLYVLRKPKPGQRRRHKIAP